MTPSNERLKLILERLSVSNKELAKVLEVDPSLVTRWLSGERQLKYGNQKLRALADYVLAKSETVEDVQWLQTQFRQDDLPGNLASVGSMQKNLMLWLASDKEAAKRRALTADEEEDATPASAQQDDLTEIDSPVKLGYVDIALALGGMLQRLKSGSTVDIFLSSDHLTTIVNHDIAALLKAGTREKDLAIRLVVCVSGNTEAVSALIDTYMLSIISGHIELFIVHGITQSVTNEMHLILPDKAVMLVTETPGSSAPPVATCITDASFVREMELSFLSTFHYAQPALTLYGDEYTRDVIEILAMEYCTPGALDVIKDSINPMFMSTEAYNRFLKTRGHSGQEVAWRSGEFAQFKVGMDSVVKGGAVFREIISLSRLNDVVQSGCCRMAGLYFLERGYIDLDRNGCLAILNGYIDYLKKEPNFSLLILDDLPELHGNNCWHIKRDSHVSVNNWQGEQPVMIYTDQLMLLREFQSRYDALWEKGAGVVGNRANVISILQDVIKRLEP